MALLQFYAFVDELFVFRSIHQNGITFIPLLIGISYMWWYCQASSSFKHCCSVSTWLWMFWIPFGTFLNGFILWGSNLSTYLRLHMSEPYGRSSNSKYALTKSKLTHLRKCFKNGIFTQRITCGVSSGPALFDMINTGLKLLNDRKWAEWHEYYYWPQLFVLR